jgi:hypothetical protein
MGDDGSARERKVRFHGRVQFKTIRHVADFTDDEIQEGWYRKKDFMRMSEEVSEIAQLVAQGKESHNGEELSIRGLEHLVEEDVADYRAEKMIASIDAVLDEQDEQRDEDINDPEVIAKIYTEIATPLLREAYLVGLRDAKEAAVAAEQMPDLPKLQPEAVVPNGEEEEKEAAPMEDDPPAKNLPKKKAPKKKVSGKIKKVVKKVPKPAEPIPLQAAPSVEEGEEMLNMGDDSDEEDSAKKATVKKPQLTATERKAAAEERRNRIRTGVGSEMSPLIRRRDGSFAFRNKELDHAQAELKKERQSAVRDSLFKFLDTPDPSSSFGIR